MLELHASAAQRHFDTASSAPLIRPFITARSYHHSDPEHVQTPLCRSVVWTCTTCVFGALVTWRCGNAFHLINEVTLRRAELVLRWVTARRHRPTDLGM